MLFTTNKNLHPTNISVAGSDGAYVIAHPSGDGPMDMDTSLVFSVKGTEVNLVRIFDIELTSIVCENDNTLICVDGYSGVYILKNGVWRDFPDIGDDIPRVNSLKYLGDRTYGIAGDGIICLFDNQNWVPITTETEDLYLYDLAQKKDGTLVATGEDGFVADLVGSTFDRWELATDVDITSALKMNDGRLLFTGWKSTILVGDRDEITDYTVEETSWAFPNAVAWGGKYLIAATKNVLSLDNQDVSEFSGKETMRLEANGSQLWRQADLQLSRYVDGDWKDVTLVAEL